MIPAGPYRLDDLRPSGNGDLVVTLEDESGHKTERIYPVTTLPTLLRAGDYNYNLALGKKITVMSWIRPSLLILVYSGWETWTMVFHLSR